MVERAEIHLVFKQNMAYPNSEEPKRRFDKELSASPWAKTISGSIYLDDPAWELLGHPKQLEVTIRSSTPD